VVMKVFLISENYVMELEGTLLHNRKFQSTIPAVGLELYGFFFSRNFMRTVQ
jgi:hypothetical protein